MKKILKKLAPSPKPGKDIPVEAGLYPYMRERDGEMIRFHLRVEPDGRGLLLANAAGTVRLNPPGVVMVKNILEDKPDEEIVSRVEKAFKGASPSEIKKDLESVKSVIQSLLKPCGEFPVVNMDDEALSPHALRLMAPFSADIPFGEPETMEKIIQNLWEAGVPNITIHYYPPGDSSQLIRVVEKAEDLGMIAGVRARASDLVSDSLARDLAMAGVDYIETLYVSHNSEIHDSWCGKGDRENAERIFQTWRELEVCPTAVIPLTEKNIDELEITIERLRKTGVRNFSCFAIAAPDDWEEEKAGHSLRASSLPQAAAMVEEISEEENTRFIWLPPVKRNPAVSFREQLLRGPRCSGDFAIRVEADGSVIPARGPDISAGNILNDAWKQLWKNEAFNIFRKKLKEPDRCETCPGLALCAAACPRDESGWARYEKD
mgnify:CR=1 FL=1